jgi:predicted  nucleic acid-binding Zn-ribbon protein
LSILDADRQSLGNTVEVLDKQVFETVKESEEHLSSEVQASAESASQSADLLGTMAEDLEQSIPLPYEPKSPPIAASKGGGYSINWDEFDENTNPFQPKKRLSSSPPAVVRSPTLPGDGQMVEDINPLNASRRLATSPTPTADVPTGMVGSPAKRPERRSVNNNKPELVPDSEVLENPVGENEMSVIQNEEKTESLVNAEPVPKKKPVAAKSGLRRFKPPPRKNLPVADDDEIQIFVPGAVPKVASTSDTDPNATPASARDIAAISEVSKPVDTVVEDTCPMAELTDKLNNSLVMEKSVLPAQPSVLPTADTSAAIPSASYLKADDRLTKSAGASNGFATEERVMCPDRGDRDMSGSEEQPQEASDEEFYNAVEAFADPASLDLLEKLGNTSEAAESALSRQSLYVKFDPLVQRRNTPDSQKVKSRIKESVCTTISESDDLLLMNTPPRPVGGAQLKDAAGGHTEALAVNNSPLVDKIFACSPPDLAKSKPAADILSTTVHPTDSGDANDIVQVLKYTQLDVNRLNKEWELDFQAQLLAKERDWALKSEEQNREWEKKLADILSEKQRSDDRVKRLQKSHEDMKGVMAEYESTIQKLIAEKQKTTLESKGSMADLVKERDQALEDLQSVETAFSDLHRRYEKSKTVLESMKKNEDVLKKCVADYQTKLKRMEEKFQLLKKQAEDKLAEASDEIARVRRSNESEMAVLQAAVRKAEMQAQSLEQTVDQKTKENRELTAICDELISKVGSR